MEIINECDAMLANFEVYALLEETQNKPKENSLRVSQASQNFNTITYETLKYLKASVNTNLENQSNIQQFMKTIEKYNFTKAEKLMLVNLLPSTQVEIQLIIEESEERLSEDQVEEILALIQKHFPKE